MYKVMSEVNIGEINRFYDGQIGLDFIGFLLTQLQDYRQVIKPFYSWINKTIIFFIDSPLRLELYEIATFSLYEHLPLCTYFLLLVKMDVREMDSKNIKYKCGYTFMEI